MKTWELRLSSNERGAASIWVVVILVVLLMGVGLLAYVQSSERSKALASQASMRTQMNTAEVRADAATQKLYDLSAVVGYKDEGPLNASRINEIKETCQGLRDGISAVGNDATTLQKVVEALRAHSRDLQNQVNSAKDQLDQAQTARDTAESNRQDTVSQKDNEFQTLQQQLDDERTRAASQEQQDQSRIVDLQSQIDDIEARNRSQLAELESEKSALGDEVRERESRIAELSRKLTVHRLPDEPDGSVLEVSNTGVCYIDRGRSDMLRVGTRFRVFSYGKGGTMIPKGLIEVRNVQEEMSEASVLEVYNDLAPLASGDMIAAPYYSPNQEREFVLVGRFPAGYSTAMVADRLRALGAKVSDQVTASTDILVIGGKEQSADSDAGPVDPRDSEAFQLAKQYQVQVMEVDDILDFVKYE